MGSSTGSEPVASSRCSQRTRGLAVHLHTVLPSSMCAQPFSTCTPAFAQQRGHAAGEAVDDAVLPAHGLRDVDAGLGHADAQRRAAAWWRAVELLGHMDQRLGRNAADVQAGAAQLPPSTSTVGCPVGRRGWRPHSRRGRRR
jgi:hypothetical protein